MSDSMQIDAIVIAFQKLPADCRYPPATEQQLAAIEAVFGAIPAEYRWFLKTCGGGVCGREWLDGMQQLAESQRKFRDECRPGGWTMNDVFITGWDGCGNPIAIQRETGRVLTEDHDFGGIHELAESLIAFLAKGYQVAK